MEKKALTIFALILSTGVIIGSVALALGISSARRPQRTVVVKGLSEIERPADHVIWPITYTVTGDDLGVIFNIIEKDNKTISQFLNAGEIQSEDISIAAPSVVDTKAERYASPTPAAYRYIATQVITISSAKVEQARTLMTKQIELLKNNIAITTDNWQYQTKFLFNNLEDVKPMMIEQATKNARLSAEKFAQDSQSKLGKIKTASQGQLSIEDRDQNTSYIKKLRVVTTIEYMLED